jgi:organic radical activating enzyme
MLNNTPKMKMFIDTYVPVTTCNLRCKYCYITQRRLFAGSLPKFNFSPEIVAKALSQERLGGICHFNICGGGETLIPPQMTDYICAILEQGHYVMIITNGTISKRFDEIVQLPPSLLRRLCFKFSFHYREIKEKCLVDQFFANIHKVREAGCSFSLELTPSDEDIPLIAEIMQVSKDKAGAACHVTVARDETSTLNNKPILTKLSREGYEKTWDVFKSDMFCYKMSVFGHKRNEFCYAGAWSGYLNLGSGVMTQCYQSFSKPQNIFEKPDTSITRIPIGRKCKEPHCFNAHAFLTLGLIPELDSIEYARIRNKMADDGTEWLNPQMKEFLSNRLKETNKEYSYIQKIWHSIRYSRPVRIPGVLLNMIKRSLGV